MYRRICGAGVVWQWSFEGEGVVRREGKGLTTKRMMKTSGTYYTLGRLARGLYHPVWWLGWWGCHNEDTATEQGTGHTHRRRHEILGYSLQDPMHSTQIDAHDSSPRTHQATIARMRKHFNEIILSREKEMDGLRSQV